MKKVISRIAIVLSGMFLALSANAQTSENPRKIWVVAHACNAHKWLQTALEDGANGVEIDVDCPKQVNPTSTYVDFSVAHDGYVDPERRALFNLRQYILDDDDLDDVSLYFYVSLQEYLNFKEMDYLSILWLDCKCKEPGQVYHLVKEVHRILLDRYGSKDLVPFSIIYGVYDMHTLEDAIGSSYSVKYSGTVLIDWLRDNLWENEGTGLACEGPAGPYKTKGKLEDLEKFFNGHNFPKGKHFASMGTGGPFFTFKWNMVDILVELKNWRNQGRYCVRTGAWTLGKEEYAMHFVPNKADYPKSYGTECDLVLVEAQNNFVPAGVVPWLYDHFALQKFVRRFFTPGGTNGMDSYYRTYNRGHYFLAGNRWEDPFYK